MSKNTLSIIPFYGGKARMARFIAERLNYDDSDIYIEPFGGACRVLLNKPRHKIEIYNDYDSGLVAIIDMLSDPEKAREFIYRLDETEYSKEQFEWAKEIYEIANMSLEDYSKKALFREIRKLLVNYDIINEHASIATIKAVLKDEDKKHILIDKIKDDNSQKK